MATAQRRTEGAEVLTEDQLTGEIIGAAIEVHRVLRPGLLESIYEGALCHEFEIRHLRVERQVSIDVIDKGHTIKGHRLDLVVDKRVVSR